MALEVLVLVTYALGMLILGWFGMSRSKTQEDFLVAGRNLGPGMYIGTMAATVLGGASTVGSVRLGYVHGISGFWPLGTTSVIPRIQVRAGSTGGAAIPAGTSS